MQGSKAAIRYAKAILNLAEEKDQTEEIHSDMELILKTLKENKELQSFLKSPIIKEALKKNALKEIFSSVNPITKELFEVLVQNGRINILQWVAIKYRDLYNEAKGIQIAKVTTAVPLTRELEIKIQQKVKELTGNTAQIENIVDASIIGGFILRVGDIQYNASVSTKLKKVKRELQNTTYISKL